MCWTSSALCTNQKSIRRRKQLTRLGDVHELDGDFLSSLFVLGQMHLAKAALAQQLVNRVVVQNSTEVK